MHETPPPDLTIEDARRIIADLNGRISRLTDENQGLYERIKVLEAAEAEQYEELDGRVDEAKESCDFWNEYAGLYEETAKRNLQLEAEVTMLRRSRGAGIGRGRPANWTLAQAMAVRELKADGVSYRCIADRVGLTLSQVQTILKPRVAQDVTRESREDRLAARALDVERYVAAVKRQKDLARRKEMALRRAAAAGKNRKRLAGGPAGRAGDGAEVATE